MNEEKKNYGVFIVVGVVILAIGLGAFFWVRSGKSLEDLKNEELSILNELSAAKTVAATERGKLSSLEEKYRTAYPLFILARDQYEKMSGAVRRSDAFFKNPNSQNPEFAFQIESQATVKDLNTKRAQANLVIARWKGKIEISRAREITPAVIAEMKRDAESIRAFLDALGRLVDGLSAGGTLSNYNIDNLQASLIIAIGDIETAVASLNAPTPVKKLAATASTTVPNGGEEETDSPDPEIYYEEIITQENTVVEAEADVAAIEQALELLQEIIENMGGTPENSEEDSEDNSQEDDDSDSSNDEDDDDENNPTPPPSSPEIEVQPGAPTLIQGSNSS